MVACHDVSINPITLCQGVINKTMRRMTPSLDLNPSPFIALHHFPPSLAQSIPIFCSSCTFLVRNQLNNNLSQLEKQLKGKGVRRLHFNPEKCCYAPDEDDPSKETIKHAFWHDDDGRTPVSTLSATIYYFIKVVCIPPFLLWLPVRLLLLCFIYRVYR